jgi:hypothetical protein
VGVSLTVPITVTVRTAAARIVPDSADDGHPLPVFGTSQQPLNLDHSISLRREQRTDYLTVQFYRNLTTQFRYGASNAVFDSSVLSQFDHSIALRREQRSI